MSGVRNLRAMFENKGDDASPTPDRGRSPAPGFGTPTPTDASATGSPRPLSKVRTQFVAITEKDGRVGLRRNPSDESSISRRRLSNDTDAEPASTFPEKPVMASLDQLAKPARKNFEPIPESPRQPTEATDSTAGAVSDKPSTNPDKTVDAEQSPAALRPVFPVTKVSEEKIPKAALESISSNGRPKTIAESRRPAEKPKPTEKPKDAVPKVAAKATPAVKPAAVPAKTTSTTASNKTTSTSKNGPAVSKPVAKAPTKPVERTTRKESVVPARGSIAKTTASSMAKKPVIPKAGERSETGFVKPRPRSPTKPVKLPASLMAHTASSVHKGSATRQVTKQPSTQNLGVPGRPASRASTAGTTRTVRRQPSNIDRSRSSIGPPPKKTAQPEASKKKESNVDEVLLARMMRPTQSSSSKTSDKPPPTPPRGTPRQSVGERSSTSSTQRDASKQRSLKSQSPLPMSVRQSSAGIESKPGIESIAEIAPSPDVPIPSIEQPDDTEEDVAVPKTKTVKAGSEVDENAQEDPEPIKLATESIDTAAQESATVETVQEATEIAEKADLVQAPVESETVRATSPVVIQDAKPAVVEPEEKQETIPAVTEPEEEDISSDVVEPEPEPVKVEAKTPDQAESVDAEKPDAEAVDAESIDADTVADAVQESEPVSADVDSSFNEADDAAPTVSHLDVPVETGDASGQGLPQAPSGLSDALASLALDGNKGASVDQSDVADISSSSEPQREQEL